MFPAWISAILLDMFVSIYNLAASMLVLALLLTIKLSICYSEDLESVEMVYYCSPSFDEKLVVVS